MSEWNDLAHWMYGDVKSDRGVLVRASASRDQRAHRGAALLDAER